LTGLFPRLRPSNALEQTAERIVGLIKARLLSPGDKLPSERELAHKLGVSRSTLRDCFHALNEAGYLETRSGRRGGTFIACWPGRPPSTAETLLDEQREPILAQLDLRRAVEPAAAELAARRARLIDVAELEGRYYSMVGVEHSFERYRARDVRFHVGIAQVSHSPLLLQAVTEVHMALAETLDLIALRSPQALRRSNVEHGHILEAIRQRQASEARERMLEHLLGSERFVSALLGWLGS